MKRILILLLIIFVFSFLLSALLHKNNLIANHEEINRMNLMKTEDTRIIFVGDVMFDWSIRKKMNDDGVNSPLTEVSHIVKSADYAVLNLETAIGTLGEKEDKQFTFQSPPDATTTIKENGFDLVSLANNHAMDFGRSGLRETISLLNNADIKYIGAGNDVEEAYKPLSLKLKGKNINFYGYSQVLPSITWYANQNGGIASGYQTETVLQNIKSHTSEDEFTIVYVHWGSERSITPNQSQINFSHELIDNGVDAVLGSHPHVLQGIEFYKEKPIVYSLGNFLFPDYVNGDAADSVIAELNISNDLIYLDLIPTTIKQSKSSVATGDDSKRIINKLIERSKLISDSNDFQISETSNGKYLRVKAGVK